MRRVRLDRALLVLAILSAVGCSNAPEPTMSRPSQGFGRHTAPRTPEPWREGRDGSSADLFAQTAAPQLPGEVACAPSGRDPRTVGVVVIHGGHTFNTAADGKRSRMPEGRSIDPLVGVLKRAGFQVLTPEMPWSLAHPYDRSFDEALDEIAAAVAQLKAHGAERVVIVGHSFGGGAVIGFGAWRGGVDGVAALAAGLNPDAPPQRGWRAESVAQAEAMTAAGRADTIAPFADFNGPYQGTVYTSPVHYLSFFSPDSHFSLHRNLEAWPPRLPLLWIDGSDEVGRPAREGMVRRAMRHEPLMRYVVVPAWHDAVPAAAAGAFVAWIGCL